MRNRRSQGSLLDYLSEITVAIIGAGPLGRRLAPSRGTGWLPCDSRRCHALQPAPCRGVITRSPRAGSDATGQFREHRRGSCPRSRPGYRLRFRMSLSRSSRSSAFWTAWRRRGRSFATPSTNLSALPTSPAAPIGLASALAWRWMPRCCRSKSGWTPDSDPRYQQNDVRGAGAGLRFLAATTRYALMVGLDAAETVSR